MGRYVTYHDMMASPPPFSFAPDCTASARRTYLGATSTTLAHMPCTRWPLPLCTVASPSKHSLRARRPGVVIHEDNQRTRRRTRVHSGRGGLAHAEDLQEIIATASDDESIGIWDFASVERVGTLEVHLTADTHSLTIRASDLCDHAGTACGGKR